MLMHAFQQALMASRWLASASPDGVESWAAFVQSVRQTLTDEGSRWPVLAGLLGVVLVLWLNLRLARWLMARWERSGGG